MKIYIRSRLLFNKLNFVILFTFGCLLNLSAQIQDPIGYNVKFGRILPFYNLYNRPYGVSVESQTPIQNSWFSLELEKDINKRWGITLGYNLVLRNFNINYKMPHVYDPIRIDHVGSISSIPSGFKINVLKTKFIEIAVQSGISLTFVSDQLTNRYADSIKVSYSKYDIKEIKTQYIGYYAGLNLEANLYKRKLFLFLQPSYNGAFKPSGKVELNSVNRFTLSIGLNYRFYKK